MAVPEAVPYILRMSGHRGRSGQGAVMDWARILAYVTGTVDQERATLGEIGHRLGRKALSEVAIVARPDTVLAWHRKLVARKSDGSKDRHGPDRLRITREVEQLIVRMVEENRDWGYDPIAGALANLGYKVSDQTIGNVLQRQAMWSRACAPVPAADRERPERICRTLSCRAQSPGKGQCPPVAS
jgi:Homeodomain-like domain